MCANDHMLPTMPSSVALAATRLGQISMCPMTETTYQWKGHTQKLYNMLYGSLECQPNKR